MRKAIIAALLTAGMLTSPAAFAAGGPAPCNNQGGPNACAPDQANNGKAQKNGQPQKAGAPQPKGHNAPAPQPQNQKAPPQQGKGNSGHNQSPQKQAHHGPRKGDTLPPGGRGQPVPPSAYQRHHLPPPAKGRQWVQIDGTYALISIATGLVFSVMAGQ